MDSTHIQLKGADPFGEVSNASLVLRARVVPVNPMPDSIIYENSWNGSRATTTKDGANVGLSYPDIINELQDADRMFCMSVRSEPFSNIPLPHKLYGRSFSTPDALTGNEMIMGLALVQDPTNKDVYRRVGLMRWVKKSLFMDLEPSVITLV